MLRNYIITKIAENFAYTPTQGQRSLIEALATFITDKKSNQIFLVKGYAGTGKTTIISALVKALAENGQQTVLLAPTGRAAKVISAYAEDIAYTIHKQIYRQKSANDIFGKFVLDKNLSSETIFIIDEASMISNQSSENNVFGSGRLLDDVIEYVYSGKNCRLIFVGDTAQLPPVGINISPALDKKNLESFGKEVLEIILNEVVRQSLESGILFNATLVRNLIPVQGQEREFIYRYPQLQLPEFKDIKRISGSELLEEIDTCYQKYGMEETKVVNRTNKLANRYNQGIRNKILFREEEISSGDFLMVVKNNYFWMKEIDENAFIANGDMMRIVKVIRFEEKHGFRFADVRLQFVDFIGIEVSAKILINTIYSESPALCSDDNQKLYVSISEEYAHMKNAKSRFAKVKEDPYFNALQVKFGYAVTCHKAQGGQWKVIFVDQGFINNEMLNIEYLRWLYTAITRATEKLYLVNFKDDFFGRSETQIEI